MDVICCIGDIEDMPIWFVPLVGLDITQWVRLTHGIPKMTENDITY